MLNRLKVDEDTYNSVFERFSKYIEYVDDIKQYFVKGYTDKHVIRVDAKTKTFIIQGYRLNTIDKEVINGDYDWKQFICVLDESLDGPEDTKFLPWANVANKKIYGILKKYYKQSEIDNIFKDHEEDNHRILHQLLPTTYHDGKVHKFTDCVYYDINKAHTAALIELFPLAESELLKLDKNYINIFVGDLCNHEHRGTWAWIVNRTRRLLEQVIQMTEGCPIYINTDGAIIYRPKHLQRTSKMIGEIKSVIQPKTTVYAYVCYGEIDSTTHYTLYQFEEIGKPGFTLKGNARLSLRKGMDLSKGIVNKAKIRKEGAIEKLDFFRTEHIEVVEE